jgi:hypothetical protein
VFGCAYYPNLSAKATHKLASRSTRSIFLGYSADHKGYRCLNLTTTNIVVSRQVVFYEADFPVSVSPSLTNNLDIFCRMTLPVRLPCPHHSQRPMFHRAFHHWPWSDRTQNRGWRLDREPRWSNRPRNRGGWSDRESRRSNRHPGWSDCQDLHRSFIACFIDFSRPRAAPMTSAAPHATPSTPPAPRVASVSMTTAAPPTASKPYPLHYSRRPQAAQEPPALPLHQQSPPVKVVLVAHPVNPHPMTTRAKRGFRLTDSPCRPPRRQPHRRYPPPSAPPSPI